MVVGLYNMAPWVRPTNPFSGCIFQDYWHVKSIVNNLVVYAETEDLFPNISFHTLT